MAYADKALRKQGITQEEARMAAELIKSSMTTVQNGVAKADGKISLTGNELRFVPFNQQLGLGPYTLKRDDICAVEKCLATGGGIFPISADALRVILNDGKRYEFILADTSEWLTLL